MKTGYIYSILVLSAVITITCCSKDAVSIQSDMAPVMYQPAYENINDTKGNVLTGAFSDNFDEFMVSAWLSDGTKDIPLETGYAKVKHFVQTTAPGNDYWSTVDSKGNRTEFFWKTKDGNIQPKIFFAYVNLPSSASISNNKDSQSLTYSASSANTPDKQSDILLGTYKGTGLTKTDNKSGIIAPITFVHPLTAVRFEKGDIKDFLSTDKIISVSIRNVYSSGTCTATPSDASAPKLTWNASGTTTVSLTSLDNILLFIPQNQTDMAASVSIRLTRKGVEETIEGPLGNDNLKAGTIYTYKLNYTDPMKGTLDVTLKDWSYLKGLSDKDYFNINFK